MSRKAAHRPRVLVVDDNRDAADMAAALIRLQACVVERAYDGPTALALAATFRPEFVLLDIEMPAMDGFTVARLLRDVSGLEFVKIFAHTGIDAAEFRASPGAVSFDGHIAKVQPGEDFIRALLALIAASRGSAG
jgi:two-component system, chemotaxis family, CheB/CheR fusion protein